MKRTILVTGAGGSLGKEFVKYLIAQKQIVIGLDSCEWSVAELKNDYPQIKVLLKDIGMWRFDQDPCDLVINCAAYKHVGMGEENPHDFIDNNLVKTGKLFSEAYKNGADILQISSDKAVEPISTYGFTKALGEKLCSHYNGHIARLGNVLDSSGSVIPVWEQAIREGKKIKVTDLEMTRYLIDVDKAVREIWNQYLEGKKLIIPDMGKPVKLYDILLKVLKKHHLDYADIQNRIEIIGMRRGEKMNERLRWEWEGCEK
jgi:FlaA1/EpsC-like NDP-sugar epimerase